MAEERPRLGVPRAVHVLAGAVVRRALLRVMELGAHACTLPLLVLLQEDLHVLLVVFRRGQGLTLVQQRAVPIVQLEARQAVASGDG